MASVKKKGIKKVQTFSRRQGQGQVQALSQAMAHTQTHNYSHYSSWRLSIFVIGSFALTSSYCIIEDIERLTMNETVAANNRENEINAISIFTQRIAIIKIFQATGVTCFNIMIIYAYVTMGGLRRKMGNYLLFVQSFADMYIGLLMWFELILDYMRSSVYLIQLSLIYIGSLEYSVALSLGTLTLCSFERLLYIRNPSVHESGRILRRMVFATIFLWSFSLIAPLTLLGLMRYKLRYYNSTRVIVYSCIFDAFCIAIVGLVVVILSVALRNIKKEIGEKMDSLAPRNQLSLYDNGNQYFIIQQLRKDLRLVKMFILMIFTYVITYLPHMIGRLLYDVGALRHVSSYHHVVLINICHVLYKTSAFINPILTIVMKDDFRDSLRKSLHRNTLVTSPLNTTGRKMSWMNTQLWTWLSSFVVRISSLYQFLFLIESAIECFGGGRCFCDRNGNFATHNPYITHNISTKGEKVDGLWIKD